MNQTASANPGAIHPVWSDGERSSIKGDGLLAEQCIQVFDRNCLGAGLGAQQPTIWVEARRRIALGLYMRELVRLSHVGDTKVLKSLDDLEKGSVKDINRDLREVRSRDASRTVQMAISAEASIDTLELDVVRSWNTLVWQKPFEVRAKVPVLLVAAESEFCQIAGEKRYMVQTEPPGAIVRLISNLDWQVCIALGRDPWQDVTCPGWTQLTSDTSYLAGKYRYEVRWRGGRISRAVFDVGTVAGDEIILK